MRDVRRIGGHLSAPLTGARYRYLPPEDVAHLPPKDAAEYHRERARFDAEVRQHVAHAREHGWIDVGTKGREVRFAIPVTLNPRASR